MQREHHTTVSDSDDERARQLGARLRELRDHQGLSQRELAARSGVSLRQIQRIEQHAVVPHFETIRRLATALRITVLDLVAFPRQGDADGPAEG